MARQSRWNIAAEQVEAPSLAEQLRVSRIVAQILLNRGFSQTEVCHAFLRPSLKMLHEPALLPGMGPACDRIAEAVRQRQHIVLYGDYDVDGITGSAILYHALRALGADVRVYIPHRIDEGYGLTTQAIAKLCDGQGMEGGSAPPKPAQLIVTIDCGITALAPAEEAGRRGVDLVITDHHEWKLNPEGRPHLPNATAIVHPRLGLRSTDAESLSRGMGDESAVSDPQSPPAPTPYPNPHLCGAGVAFKVAWGVGQALLGQRVGETFKQLLVEMTALCALGTIADVVPLVGENRVIASFGLQCLPKSNLPGIRAILDSANLTGEALDAFHVGFLLGPRLNAAGRMGHARLALELLTTDDAERAGSIATYLEAQNKARQATEKETLDEVLAEIARLGDDREDCPAILLAGANWHPGVIGIVASRVVERFHRPTVLISLQPEAAGMGPAVSTEPVAATDTVVATDPNVTADAPGAATAAASATAGLGVGSGRSIPGFHLAQALQHCSDLLVSHGGHEMAAGLKVRPEHVAALRERFQEYARQNLRPELLTPELKLECETGLGEMTESLVADLARLGPFGHGNRKPLLACRNVELAQPPRRVGKSGNHAQLLLRQNGTLIKAIAFNQGDLADTLKPGQKIDLAVEPTLNHWNGRTTVEVQVKDVRV